MKKIIVLFSLILMTACNSVYIKPNTMEPGAIIQADPAGTGLERAIKEHLEKRGYDVRIGKQKKSEDGLSSSKTTVLPADTQYIFRAGYSTESFMPWWCVFNGFWWWKFSVSIADQKTGEEILSWRGRGCQNSSLRKLDRFLDELEIKND